MIIKIRSTFSYGYGTNINISNFDELESDHKDEDKATIIVGTPPQGLAKDCSPRDDDKARRWPSTWHWSPSL